MMNTLTVSFTVWTGQAPSATLKIQACLQRGDGEEGAVGYPCFNKDAFEVRAHGLGFHDEGGGDIAITHATGKEAYDLAFTVTEGHTQERSAGGVLVMCLGLHCVEDPARHFGG